MLAEFFDLFPATLELSICAVLFAIVFGLPAGMLAGVKRNSPFDHMVMGVTVAGYSLPIFVWGLVLILTFSLDLGWTPVSGRISLDYDFDRVTGFMTIDALLSDQEGAFASALSHLILPTIVLGTIPLAVIARMTRSSMLEVLGEDYIRTARAKGLAPSAIVAIHALRNAMIPVVTVIGLQVGTLMGGAILTETIFSWPGVGKWLVGIDQPARLPGAPGRRAAHRLPGDERQSPGRSALRGAQPPHPAEIGHGRAGAARDRSIAQQAGLAAGRGLVSPCAPIPAP